MREGKLKTVYAEIRPQTWSGDITHSALEGSTLGYINPQDEHFGELKGKGFVVRNISPDSPASRLDLEVGDVILYVPQSRYNPDGDTEIDIYRDGETLTISTSPE